MKAARMGFLLCLLLACIRAVAAPQLVVPHGRLGHTGSEGPAAIWRGEAGASFAIETRGDIRNATGTVQRRGLDVSAQGDIAYAADIAWDAAGVLAAPAARNVHTFDPSAPAGAAFQWAALPAAARALLDQPEPGAAPDGRGEARTAFLRGERSGEAGQPEGLFRRRAGVLGDVVNSTPLIVGAPTASISDDGHAAFRARFKARELAVYVGANDGMLHAFSAATGAELFAYVPGALLKHLPALASPAYRPRPYVDGSAGHGDVRIDGNWRTALVCGMGMGARGVFALDITDPARFGQGPGPLWEFTEADDPAMGHVRTPPLIARIGEGKGAKDAKDAKGAKGASARDYAVVSSGINNLMPGGDGALFLLALDKPRAEKWRRGVNFAAIATAADPLQPNALSAPKLVTGADGSATRAYAGDLQGNLWRFDFATMAAHRLFTARDQDGVPQPIAHAPQVVFAPGGGYLILFATGKLIEESDLLPASFRQQTMYAIHDAPGVPAPIRSRSQLAERTLAAADALYAVRGKAFDYAGADAKRGWYFDFPNAGADGERAAASPASVAGAVVIATMLPGAPGGAQAAGRLYVLDAVSGFAYDPAGAKSAAVTGTLTAINPLLPLLLVDGALVGGQRNATGGAIATRRVTVAGPQGAAARIEVRFRSGRVGWREVGSWQELHDAATRGRR